jgi:hypothetical protein
MEIKITVKINGVDFKPFRPPKSAIIALLALLIIVRPAELPTIASLLH